MENTIYIKEKLGSYEFEVAGVSEEFVERKHEEWKKSVLGK